MRKQSIAILAVVVAFLTGFSVNAYALSGSGTAADPYLIQSLADFDEFAANSSYWTSGVHTKLMCDIDLTGRTYNTAVIAPDTDNTNNNSFEGVVFAGIFDGNGHIVSNLTINATVNNNDYLGLFGLIATAGAVVNNLGLQHAIVSGGGGSGCVGCLVGQNGSGKITDCIVRGTVIGGWDIGGMVGFNGGSINKCNVYGKVSSSSNFIGGLAGRNYGDINGSSATCMVKLNYNNDDGIHSCGGLVGFNGGNVRNSFAEGVVVNERGGSSGGLVGKNGVGSIINCYATVSVIGYINAGGLVGWNQSGIANCFADGVVKGIHDVGGLVGGNSGVIDNSHATGTVISSNDSAGGLVGYSWDGSIRKCYATGMVSSVKKLAGLVGTNYKTSIRESYATGYVNGNVSVGGLVGENSAGTISTCYATGKISGNERIGGLIGSNYYGHIEKSYATGSVIGDSDVGGLVGQNRDNSNIVNCYATSVVIGDDFVGGLVGDNGLSGISDSYSSGMVIGQVNRVGGLVGNNELGQISNCFWNMQTSGMVASSGGIGKTTAQMQTKSTFTSAGWDFGADDGDVADWWMPTNDYPQLIWQLHGDINRDGQVNLCDFAIMSNVWLSSADGTNYNIDCDLSNDGIIDIADLTLLNKNWMAGVSN